jgi:hypothetical protein
MIRITTNVKKILVKLNHTGFSVSQLSRDQVSDIMIQVITNVKKMLVKLNHTGFSVSQLSRDQVSDIMIQSIASIKKISVKMEPYRLLCLPTQSGSGLRYYDPYHHECERII